ncbi:tetratricopeptide repeat protein [Nitrospina watsonii]|uniref:UDP-N-acetylglucosamine--peptide N-acetylglucosaminyltransferase SPINDLY n=1 Tax=Nitrospina watsonii TaxID=1323948 RepID=A0ABM9HBU0_9BACT|nr:tetratricopeptide repeat protein [Nitrospina watsonii]CAI2717565.1 putative UDP-N-acetylglucosamine--peptide N-acetylglucosaminyltransferase SPINDLY [Nitrospina watsonii]
MEIPSLNIDQLLQEAARALNEARLDEARDCLQQILKLDPNQFDALHILGVLAFQAGNSDEAEKLIRQALAVNDEFSEAHYNLGKVLREQKQLQEAADAYRKAVEINDRLDPAWFNLGLLEMERSHTDLAAKAFRRAVEIDPNDPDYAFNLGNALCMLGDVASGQQQFERAVELNPQHVHAWNNLGIALRETEQWEPAVSAYNRALEINPDFADAYFNLGNLYEQLGNRENALASYRHAVRANPGFAKAFTNLGNIYHAMQRLDLARDAYDKALALDPASPSARHMIDSLDGTTTDTAPPDYVVRLFDKAAPEFEERLVVSLRYQSPIELRQMLDAAVPAEKKFERAVDLGCGTGLSGEAFRSRAERLMGVDLSGKMVQKAREKNIYDALFEEGLVDFLNRSPVQYDLFIAADVLVYIGNLTPLFEAVREHALTAAWFLFSVEKIDDGDFVLRPTGRYAHSHRYIETVAKEHGFQCEAFQDSVVRMENDQPIPGYNVMLRYNEASETR